MGSLIDEQTDASGQQYKRNRYYDPVTGRFTQEDPIGLAGGVNAYGFANGDPVNYSDPFGLCPLESEWRAGCPGGEPGPESAGFFDPVALLAGGIAGGLRSVAGGAARAEGTALARQLGKAGEETAGLAKNTLRIPSSTGTAAYRIPDALTSTTLSEVKNVLTADHNVPIRGG